MPNKRARASIEIIHDENDEDIQFLLEISQESMKCQFCGMDLEFNTEGERQDHYDYHLEHENKTINAVGNRDKSNGTANMSSSSHKNQSKGKVAKKDIFWHPSENSRPPPNYTPGLIGILKRALNVTHSKGFTVRAVLCYEGMVHVATEGWDMGWGCGYRNFLMACTALYDQDVQPDYFSLLDSPPPGVRNLQSWIEEAWNAGFDQEGAGQLEHKLTNTKKWIGTAEIYVAFSYRGIPARLVDFPAVKSNTDSLIKWVENYFTSPYPFNSSPHNRPPNRHRTIEDALRGASAVVSTNRMPLILQHAGHSRTIIGFEKHKNGNTNLLIMDPSERPPGDVRDAALYYWNSNLYEDENKYSKKFKISPSNFVKNILSTGQSIERKFSSAKKRRVSNSPEDSAGSVANSSKLKRVRGGLHDTESDVVILDDTEEEGQPYTSPEQQAESSTHQKKNLGVDAVKVVDFFRLNPRGIKKNSQYQILYFPLEPPLTDEEKLSRQIVMSETIK